MPASRPRTMPAQDTIAVTLHVALEHHDRNELQAAAALYREILGIDPDHADSLFLLGMIATADGDRQAAVQLLRAAVRNRPRAAHMHAALADALIKAGRTAAALNCYWRILTLEPENPLAYVQVGDTLRSIKPAGGNDTLAASCYRRALMLDPACAMAHFGLGQTFRAGKNFAQARACYQAAIAADGKRWNFYAALADVLYVAQHYAWAADAYRRAIQLKPQSPELLRRLADALFRLGQGERAEACHQRADALQAGRIRAARTRDAGQQPAGNLRQWSDRHVPKQPATARPAQGDAFGTGSAMEGAATPAAMAHASANEHPAEKTA